MINIQKVVRVLRTFKPVNSIRLASTEIDAYGYSFEDQEPQKQEKTVNEVRLLGRVGCDPVMVSEGVKPCAKFSLATKSVFKVTKLGDEIDKTGEYKVKTDWHNIVAYNPNLVNYVTSYVKKGQRLYVSGRLSYSFSDVNATGKQATIYLNDIISISS